MKQEPLDLVLNKYGIEVLNIRNETYKDKKGVWWVQTPDGYKVLKKMSGSEETLKHMLHAVRHLSKNGIHFPRVNQAKDGSDYVVADSSCYILSDAVQGKNPSYDTPGQLAMIVGELARFHRASAGFSPLAGSKPKIHLDTWIADYEKQVEDMNRFYNIEVSISKGEVQGKTNDEIGKVILKEFPGFYKRALNAIQGLKGPEYREWVEKVRQTGGLCHQDFAAGNLVADSQGKLFVLDTDSITIDIPARDIRKILNKVIKKRNQWDMELTKKMLAYYQRANPLSPSEWHVVKLDLMFPHLFIGAMDKFYYKRDKEWTKEKYLSRLKEVSALEKTITPVLENWESIIPR